MDPLPFPPKIIEHRERTHHREYAVQNNLYAELVRPQRSAPRRGSKRTPKPEELFADAIKAGHVKVIRRRGKPPQIVWLKNVR